MLRLEAFIQYPIVVSSPFFGLYNIEVRPQAFWLDFWEILHGASSGVCPVALDAR
jgi:hypothetical protein